MAKRREHEQFLAKYGSWAIITGAGQGLGQAFAEGVAARGINLVLVDKHLPQLAITANHIRHSFDVEVNEVECDLALPDCVTTIEQACAGLDIGLLVCNAAIGKTAKFLDLSSTEIKAHIDINCTSSALLIRHVAPWMVARQKGGIILIGSATGLQGSPMFSAYAATKAFEIVLAESLWYELQPSGVDVLGFIPGPTNTPSLRTVHTSLEEGQKTKTIDLPGPTAEKALDSLGSGPVAARDETIQSRLAGRQEAIKNMGDRFFVNSESGQR